MAANISLAADSSLREINYRVILVQVFVTIFLLINVLLITTFLMKAYFYTCVRYILFANTLVSDCLLLIMTDIVLILTYFELTMKLRLCVAVYIVLSLYSCITPVTLTAMTLERYVAICMPLRHAEFCSTDRALYYILIIHSFSSIPCIVTLSIFFAFAPHSLYTQDIMCSVEVFILHRWQGHLRSAMNQLYFVIMCIAIVFSYVQIMKVAKAASGENKKSTWKGLRTVLLHAFQLLLCLIQLWCPFIEAAVLQIDFMLYINVRYFNYIVFYLASRCLSPLIYGLRDAMFFQALKYYVLCGFYKKQSDSAHEI